MFLSKIEYFITRAKSNHYYSVMFVICKLSTARYVRKLGICILGDYSFQDEKNDDDDEWQ